MATDLTPKWHPLPAIPGLPALMISPHFGTSSYTLHVTDLANVWVERLGRKGILLRSLQENTSIDLSDGDPNQWVVFLSKLDAALNPTSADHHSTSLSLSASCPDSTSTGNLALHVTCVLPEPLMPLRWPIYLTKCPPATLTTELVLPLIQAHHHRSLEVENLIARLKEKDAVIAKLVDKLDAMSMGLENVFNSLPGKRKASRETAEEKVKGLAAFDESDWRSKLDTSREPPWDLARLLSTVFAESGLRWSADPEISASDQLNDWWVQLDSNPRTAIKPKMEIPKESRETPPRESKAPQGNDDDFQEQTLPPRLQSHRRKRDAFPAADGSTGEGGSAAEIPQNSLSPSKENPRARIGVLGGRERTGDETSASRSSRTIRADGDETASEPENEPADRDVPKRQIQKLGTISKSRKLSSSPAKASSPIPLPAVVGDSGDETASGSDSDGGREEPAGIRPSSRSSITQKKPIGLGRIGGRSRATPEPSEQRSATPAEEEDIKITSPTKPPGRKLGVIGGRSNAGIKRQHTASPAKPAEPETEEQRVERRRADLAKELERKAAAPTKKKRKF
ncbi:XLF-domain-containing protein [Durotheca rogersii]|uniref:XLF-domain-containing protein n=1 Tax=Durotheca rogersii TaxID=419775 RepID=UPI002220C1FF|nr:XLF-domain-containing protein [Durotheca rogersii]KAI5865834.1 XLF-domain-containing protein [Durotheca rogersii]